MRDLREMRAYISAQYPAAAERVGLRLDQAIELIAQQPNIGHSSPDHLAREWSVPGLPYVLPYRVQGDVIEILRIFHTSRLRPPSWQ